MNILTSNMLMSNIFTIKILMSTVDDQDQRLYDAACASKAVFPELRDPGGLVLS